ncbi:zinc transporter ZIP11-like isoform X4 [Phyllopteryx taeniolatus]|uniref:zinc transporter ZIP11-like isoform X4 n=1 Tax=Phyllopteryx taeniolatus TaxID=161469 RepID=UPI002AD4F784|nr:zinc transporter ZIP11-like isoform X4 [Phyllopteryx taeniolatus]
MIEGYSPVAQALLGTLFTWGLTAAGAAMVFIFSGRQKHILDGSLGFAAGGVSTDPNIALALASESKLVKQNEEEQLYPFSESQAIKIEEGLQLPRKRVSHWSNSDDQETESKYLGVTGQSGSSWRRILLLIFAITIHNIPEGLAVGVGFGAIGKTSSATFESARNLAVGIGIQNFPEGLAVSLPLRGSGVSTWTAFWYGQLSGMVEPVAGMLGAVAVVLAEPLLPYALAFAAGAMVFVVVDDIIPEAQVSGNGKLASWTSILGFIVMMSLDVGLG